MTRPVCTPLIAAAVLCCLAGPAAHGQTRFATGSTPALGRYHAPEEARGSAASRRREVPLAVLFLFLGRFYVEGLVSSGLKL